ncbi:unnamed protein product [Phytophthora fragariaefolia]|uniref:Unnamed protein product n=1 Tax=Phytophthora fragariaefolia TaxID=1490495 RepID=A0A9W6Y6I8_9STRA|nr:unnamed protein product [Phytophthora fragariaefolia]
MVAPRSSNSADRLARDTEPSNAQRGDARASDVLARQVREVSEMERLNATPKLELATHRPLAQIKAFSGLRNKSENSMQWLRTFVYEMKGTRTPPNEWCMAFELTLRDGALHWYRQLPRKTKRRWKLLSNAFIKYYCSQYRQSTKARYYSAKREGSEHVCDYLNRLNGYARNAGVQFEKGGRHSKEHVNRFLESCGDRGLERRLCHLRVKDIHELEEIINDILTSEERSSTRENSAYLSRGRDRSHGRDERRAKTSRDGYRQDRHDRHGREYDRRMDNSRHTPRISLAEASLSELMAELQVRKSKYGKSERSKTRDMRRSLEDISSEDGEDRLTDNDQSGSDYAEPPSTETGFVPIGPPQLASPPVDADCVYAFVGESKWLKTHRREEVKEVNTTEIERERNGSFGGGESDERKTEEWNSGGSEGLVSSVTQKTWQDYHPENVIKLLSGERLGWWSAQKFDKRVRMRALVQGAVNNACWTLERMLV